MARYSNEQAVNMIGNRFELVLIAAARARELQRGHKPKFTSENRPVVTALREIEQGLIGRDYLNKIKK